MSKKTLKIIFLLLAIISVATFLTVNKTKAEDCDSKCNLAYPDDKSAQDTCEKECEDLEDQAKSYEKLIKKKSEQQDTLNNQLEYINQQQTVNQNNIHQTEKNIETLEARIENTEKEINQKEKDLKYQKKILSGLMQSYYEYDRQGVLDIVLLDDSVITNFVNPDYIQQSSLKVSQILGKIRRVQKELAQEKEELEDNHKKTTEFKEQLTLEKVQLISTENQKQTLLVKTKGEEEKYRELLAKIEEQKKELFNFSSFGSYNIGENERPEKGLSTSWYYSQKDSRWAELTIGVSSSKMKDYGCAISSVAMMYTYYGKKYTPKDILNKSDFAGDLIYWPSDWKHQYSNVYEKLKDVIDDGDVAIVHLKFSGGGHFIVVGGKDKKDYIVHDPYFGANLYLGTSLRLLGAYVDRVIYK